MFQSTRPRRARRRYLQSNPEEGGFNPRAREGRDPTGSPGGVLPTLFQSTRPRRARLYSKAGVTASKDVSIHAPAKGATRPTRRMFGSGRVSIHAPAKG